MSMHFDYYKRVDCDQLRQELIDANVPVLHVYQMGEKHARVTADVWAKKSEVDTVVNAHVPGTYNQPVGGDVNTLATQLSQHVNASAPHSGHAASSHAHAQLDVTNLVSALNGKVNDNDARLNDARTPLAHTHTTGDVTGLNNALANKVDSNDSRLSDSRTPLTHSHTIADVTNLSANLATKADLNDSRFSDARTPLSHSHAQSDITGLTAALAAKQSTSEKGIANGYASLGSDGKVPSAQLPAIPAAIPSGVMLLWFGLAANVPSGWALCDGANGTPDMRGQMPMGAANDGEVGTAGGTASHTHDDHAQLTHSGAAVADHSHTPGGSISQPTFSGTQASLTHSGAAVADHASHTHTYTEVPNHVHVEQLQGSTSGTTTGTHLMGSAATGGSLRSAGQSTANPTGGVATGTTNGPNAALTHSVTQPNAHTYTPQGSVSTPTFSGNQVTLSHSVTQPNPHTISSHSSASNLPPHKNFYWIIKL